MKILSIRIAALVVALSVMAAAAVAVFIGIEWIAIPIAGVVAYVVALVVFGDYVLHRIQPIYQIFSSRDSSVSEIRSHYRNDEISTAVQADLEKWAAHNRGELARLRENEQYRKEFVGDVSHELKTPLCSIQGYILTLLDGGLEDPSINRKYLEQSQKNIERLVATISDLEDISRLESGNLQLSPSRFDLRGLIAQTVETLDIQAAARRITIVQPNADIPVMVTADRERMSQVIVNLLSNSIKYGNDGGQTTIRLIDMFDKVMVEVKDNGIGLTPEQLPRIFERFYRADKSRSRSAGGTGLGLAIVKHILEAHHETITVRSTHGSGTTFSFTISK